MGLNVLLCHTVISAVANNLLLVGDHFVVKKFNSIFRFALHAAIASFLFYHELPKLGDTYFSYLGLPITATHSDVLKSYDKIQDFLKTGSPEVVAKIKRAYQILSNQESRILYSVYGDVDIDAKNPQDFTIIVLTVSLSYYCVSAILCCALNRSNRLKFAKYVTVLYNAIGFFLEVELRFLYAGFMKNVFYLNKLLPYQHVEFLRAIPPFVMMVASLLTHSFITDMDKLNMLLWQSAVATNGVILEKMANVVNATDYLRSLGRDNLNLPEDLFKFEPRGSGFGEFLDSLDESQKKKLVDLLSNGNGKTKKSKSKIMGFLKPALIYIVMFLIIRVFLK
ncbi:putative integral membrane protein [Theileria parva strain Muguga]|uniref:DnaJ protein, putative n=1 Tax=Theileria parva TaxID=5875 RepID=Q4N6V4_THEPA|nr:chaperone protein DnaJ [Theileria parva strain Muguga]EAN34304.1 putative integral membrane protein [Theileria parva strain Muguga]|eukprot:XP_766587.1 chaperone protein DnaJ [Theileria parva strain Muguga]